MIALVHRLEPVHGPEQVKNAQFYVDKTIVKNRETTPLFKVLAPRGFEATKKRAGKKGLMTKIVANWFAFKTCYPDLAEVLIFQLVADTKNDQQIAVEKFTAMFK